MTQDDHQETRQRALATEGALIRLLDVMATRGILSIDEVEEMLTLLAKGSEFSAARVSHSLNTISQLRKLRAAVPPENGSS